MLFSPNTIQIQYIIFDNTATEVLLHVYRPYNGALYDLFITYSELNILLNKLQQKNPHLLVCDLFDELSISGELIQFILDARQLKDQHVDVSFLQKKKSKKWVRI